MGSRFFSQILTRRLIAGGTTLGAAGFVGNKYKSDTPFKATEAEIQFNTSYGYVVNGVQTIKPPDDWNGRLFQIKNDYPKPKNTESSSSKELPPMPGPDMPLPGGDAITDAPWLNIDYVKHPERFCKIIKEYIWEGNVNNEFVVQKNPIRQWFHAPWMHWNQNGREPLNGLTFERATPPGELAKAQTSWLQNWAIGFYNEAGATVFGEMWADPNAPKWEKAAMFPLGTCVFKILMTSATDDEVSTLVGSPGLQAVICPPGSKSGANRNVNKVDEVRLLQVDFAVRDDRSPMGWVWGTFMYDGNQKNRNPWDRIIPVGLQWGNDPELTHEAYEKGEKVKESWINPEADYIKNKVLQGQRANFNWGHDGRLAGPVDNYKSACASCHSTSEKNSPPQMIPPPPGNDMKWFRNLKSGEPFNAGDVSGDNSLQLMIGWANYMSWRRPTTGLQGLFQKTKYVIDPQTKAQVDAIEAKRDVLRGH